MLQVSDIMVSPLCSIKGLNIPNSTQDFLKIHTVKEKLSAVSHSMLGHLQQPQQLRGSHPTLLLVTSAWPQRGNCCIKMLAHTR